MSRFVKSNNTKVFGVPLKVFVKKYGTAIPKGIEELITYIEAKGFMLQIFSYQFSFGKRRNISCTRTKIRYGKNS